MSDDIKVTRVSAEETFKREASFEPAGMDDTKRTCQLSFSSELPVSRGDYMEVLDHDPDNCDLSRLNDAHPLLLNHDPERQIGVVQYAAIGADKKGRATVRFSKSSLGDEIWRDVKDGIRRLVSVGYRRTKELMSETRDGMEVVRFAWQPYEVSIVSVPADSSVGIGRAAETIPQTIPQKITMSEENKAPDYQKTATEILAIANGLRGKVEQIDELAYKAIAEGRTIDQFREIALGRLPEIKPLERPLLDAIPAKMWEKYSITRAISSMQIMGGKGLDGFEKEVDSELKHKTGRSATGFWLPSEILWQNHGQRNFTAATGTLGAMLIETSNLGSQFIELLRAKSVCVGMGARVLNLNNPVTIPQQNAAGGTNWVTGTTASTLSTGNFTQITLSPKVLTAFQQYDKQLLATGNPSIDQLIRDDISQVIALEIDRVAMKGGGSGEPTGVLATTGINTVAFGTNGLALSGSTLAYPFMVSLETEVATDNADVGALGYVMHSAERGKLKVTEMFASSSGVAVYGPTNQVNGYKTGISNQVVRNLTTGTATTICSVVTFGNWADLLVAQFNGGATDLVVDPYTLGVNGVVRLIARHWVDIGVRHPVSFCAGGGIIA